MSQHILIIQGPFSNLEQSYLEDVLEVFAKVIIVQSDNQIKRTKVTYEDKLIAISVPDVGPDVCSGKPNNVRRWLTQIKAALNHIDESVLIIHRSDLQLNLYNVSDLISVGKNSVWVLDATTLARWTGFNYHYCDWMIGGKKNKLTKYIPEPDSITFKSIFGDGTYARHEYGFEFNEIRRSEQLILSKVLTKDEFANLNIENTSGTNGNNIQNIEVLSAGKYVKKFKGHRYKYRPLIFRMRPTSQSKMEHFLWSVTAFAYTLYFNNSRRMLMKYLWRKK